MSLTINSKLFLFVGITYIVTFSFNGILLLTDNPLSYVGLQMVIPFIVAIIVQKMIYKERLIPSLGIEVGKLKWYFVAIVIPIFLSFNFNMPFDKWLKLIIIGLTISTVSAFFEEAVWRGFVRYEMRNKNVIFIYSMTALIWTTWHIPISVLYLYSEDILLNTLYYCVQLYLISFIISWVRDKSHTVITAAIFHGMINVFYFS